MAERFDLTGKTALVTGAAKRIGRAIALALADQGANVIVHYNTSEREARATCAEIERKSVKAWAVQGDLSVPQAPEGLARECLDAAGAVQVVVNNASSFGLSEISDLTADELAQNMQIHALAPLTITRVLMGKLPHGEPGRVVNLVDAYVHSYQRTHMAYNLSKRALVSLTRMMALEFAPHVTVNAVAPGLILPPAEKTAEAPEALLANVPLERRGEIEDVVRAVLYLLRADFVTGQMVFVDGGANVRLGSEG